MVKRLERKDTEDAGPPAWRPRDRGRRRPASRFLGRHQPSLHDRVFLPGRPSSAERYWFLSPSTRFLRRSTGSEISRSPETVAGGAYIDYLYFSIETLSTAGYGDMHPQTHYGHFVAAVELFTGIFSMSLMTGLIFARFSRPNARLLFADSAVISNHEGKLTLMVRFVNERHNIISNATAKLWLLRNEGRVWRAGSFRRFYELPLVRSEHPALALRPGSTCFTMLSSTSKARFTGSAPPTSRRQPMLRWWSW